MNRHVFYVGMTLLCLFFLSFTAARANNVRIHGEPQVALNARQDTLSLTFTLSWDNSWRDDFNWDAVWVFGKYKKEGSTDAWLPLWFAPVQSEVNQVSVITTDGTSETRGVYVYPRKKGSYAQIKEEVTLKCRLSALAGISAADVNNGLIYFSLTGIEMVLVPYGSYYLGDNKSNSTFRSYKARLFPPEDDIIGTDTAFVYSSYPEAAVNYEPFKVTSRAYAVSYCHINSRTDSISWMVDFKTPKTIRTTAVYWIYNPTQTWHWLGSNDLEKWDTLRHCQVEESVPSGVSYPMRYPMKMEKTGAYRYYRLFAKTVGSNGFAIYNIAMSERDLYPYGEYSYYVKDEAAINYGKTVDYVYAEDGTSWSGSLSGNYPKGYRSFYCMKYEVSQEQYVSFLNMLSYSQQKNRIGGNLDALNKGEYVFGSNTKVPNCRNGIVLMSKSGTTQPAVFACNLNPAEPFNAEDDGQTLACNYMTPADMLAYLDWCGLRPLSELEYEKACRAPRKVLPREKAWNGLEQKPLTGLADVNNAGRENELPKNAGFNVNAGNGVAGPVRCGSFATANTTQEQAGATFYGIMEMSGNLGELCYHVKGGAGFYYGYGYGHGNGILDASGNYQQTSYWPRPTATEGFIIRGGSFASADTLLAVSDRSQVVKDPARRDSTVGFRGAHIAEAYTLEGGSISGAEYGCPDKPYLVTGSEVTAGDAMVVRYEWYVNIGNGFELIDGQYNKDLNYTGLVNHSAGMVTYKFKRKVYCALGEAWSNEITVKIPNPKVKLDLTRVVLDPCDYAPEITATPGMSDKTMIYAWKFAGRPIEGQTTNKYTPKREHFGGANGDLEVVCVTSLYGCVAEYPFGVEVPFLAEMKSTDVTLSNCNNATYKYGEDVYCSVRIDDQCWMAKNLNIGTYYGVGYVAGMEGIQKHCMDCDLYGGLYEWEEACSGGLVNDVKYVNDDPGTGLIQGICPEGWHIPSDEEWMMLERSLGMSEEEIQKRGDRGTDQGIQMRSIDYWNNKITNIGTNASRLNMRPGGFCYPPNSSPRCQGVGKNGYWWTTTKYDSANAYFRILAGGNSTVNRSYGLVGNDYFWTVSVRCVLNPR